MSIRGKRRSLSGVVLSAKMQSTVVVLVERLMRHSKLGKVIKRRRKVYAHTDVPLETGSKVLIMETRPMSKMKRWRVVLNSDS